MEVAECKDKQEDENDGSKDSTDEPEFLIGHRCWRVCSNGGIANEIAIVGIPEESGDACGRQRVGHCLDLKWWDEHRGVTQIGDCIVRRDSSRVTIGYLNGRR